MQGEKIIVGWQNDGFTIRVDDQDYHVSHDLSTADCYNLIKALEHITSDTVKIEMEEWY